VRHDKDKKGDGPWSFLDMCCTAPFFQNVQEIVYKMNANFSDLQDLNNIYIQEPCQVVICKFKNIVMMGAKERKNVQPTAVFEMSLVNSKGNKSS
jgi:hypothetical protein